MPRPPQADARTNSPSDATAPLVIETHAPEETRALGEALGRLAEPGSVILLSGDLGAGKTVFAQGVGRGLGAPGIVNSPTFVLCNEHLGGRLPLQHADLYRLTQSAEVTELALDEVAADGVLLVEWPERAPDVLPPDHLVLRIQPGPGSDDRVIELIAEGPQALRLLGALRPALNA